MSKNSKIALGIVICVVFLCCCLCVGGYAAFRWGGPLVFERMLVEAPGEATSVANDIINYELPPGYEEAGAVNMGIFSMVMITNETRATAPIYIVLELPAGMAAQEEQMLRQVQQGMARSMGSQGFDMRLVGQEPAKVRGQDVTLLLYEGQDEEGTPMKQVVSGFFEGKSGQVMLVILGPEAGWDQTEVDGFIRSIK